MLPEHVECGVALRADTDYWLPLLPDLRKLCENGRRKVRDFSERAHSIEQAKSVTEVLFHFDISKAELLPLECGSHDIEKFLTLAEVEQIRSPLVGARKRFFSQIVPTDKQTFVLANLGVSADTLVSRRILELSLEEARSLAGDWLRAKLWATVRYTSAMEQLNDDVEGVLYPDGDSETAEESTAENVHASDGLANSRAERFQVSRDPSQVILDGTAYALTDNQAIYLQTLWQHKDWMSASEFFRARPDVGKSARPDLWRGKLPAAIQACIETNKRKGSRICLPAQNVPASARSNAGVLDN